MSDFADSRPFMSIPATIRAPRAKTVPRGDLIIASQFNIGVYRLDFLIVGRDGFGNEGSPSSAMAKSIITRRWLNVFQTVSETNTCVTWALK
jgi:hypothetical protein